MQVVCLFLHFFDNGLHDVADHLAHAEETEIVGVASVHGAAVTAIVPEESFAVDEVHVPVPGRTGIFVCGTDDLTTFNLVGDGTEVGAGHHNDGGVRMSGAECFKERFVGVAEMFQGRCVVVVVENEDGGIEGCKIFCNCSHN